MKERSILCINPWIYDFTRAAHEMLGSRWAGQTGKRAERLAGMMKEGK